MQFGIFLLGLLAAKMCFASASEKELPFFQASQKQPYHISIGAVLFDENGRIACHHFKEILGQKDIYILMRESMENNETIFMTLQRGLKEEFGALAKPIAFLGCLSGFLQDPKLPFEKTTLYIACQMTEWDPRERDPNDPEAMSMIEWFDPDSLISIMQRQGSRFKRVDADESEMIKRALPYIKEFLNGKKGSEKMEVVKEQSLIEKVPIGAIFQHYRNKKNYKIIGIGRHSETMELQVIYQGQYVCEKFGDSPVWVRPLDMFLEIVENDGLKTPRFIHVVSESFQ